MRILSNKQQFLLNGMFFTHNLDFHSQKVFTNKRTYFESLAKLERCGFVSKDIIENRIYFNITVRGRLLVKLLKLYWF